MGDRLKAERRAPPRIGAYDVQDLLGAGGFGTVYRATAPDGDPVALKVMSSALVGDDLVRRFQREGRIRIEHPNVVRVLDAGVTDEGDQYIAFELLEGEPLSERLQAAPLPVPETVDLGLQMCAGLQAAHEHGVVHRDLKPGNVFVCADGTVKILDFGIARPAGPGTETHLTVEGAVVGTPGWLSPEQARARTDVDHRADLWALGVLLYQAVSGRHPFLRESSVSTILAVVLEEPDRLRTLAPQAPRALCEAVHRCLIKDPEARWSDAAALREALEGVDVHERPRHTSPVPSSLPVDEQRVVALLLAEGVHDPRALEASVEEWNGELIPMLGARAIAVFGGKTWEGDETARAVRAALGARHAAEWMAVASGRATGDGGAVSGDAVRTVERACAVRVAGVAVDASTARSLVGFVLEEAGAGVFQVPFDALSRQTVLPEFRQVRDDLPLVGRNAEVAQIEAALSILLEERRATAVWVSGPVGIGKSRLRRELERRLRDHPAAPYVLAGRGESHKREANLHALGTAIRNAALERCGRRRSERRTALLELCREAVGPKRCDEQADALARLVGFGDETGAEAGRPSDPQLVSDRLRIAVFETVSGLCTERPVALILDDAQWADTASLELIEELLDRSADRPLLVFVASRPELAETHPDLLARAEAMRIQPRGLVSRQVEVLGRAIAGRDLPPDVVQVIADRTGGNPLFVEQIVRELAERGQLGASLRELPVPLDVEAAVQSRLDHLPDAEKQLCKRAAILGPTFTRAGLEALGVSQPGPLLEGLGRRGLVFARSRSQPDAPYREHAFRNPLFADVAYGMNAEAARAELHARAAAHLDHLTDVDPEEVARHFEAAGQAADAADRYGRAALRAARRGDSQSVVRCAERALELGEEGEHRFELHVALADACSFLGQRDQQRAHLDHALDAARTAPQRCRALTEQAALLAGLGAHEGALEVAADAVTAAREHGEADVLAAALARQAWAQLYSGDLDGADATIREAAALSSGVSPETAALVAAWRAQLATARGDLGERRRAYAETVALYRKLGDERRAAGAETNLADTLNRVGAYAEAEEALREAVASCRRVGHRIMEGFALANLGYALAAQGRVDAALEAFDAGERIAAAVRQPRLAIAIRVYRARALLSGRPSDEAVRQAEQAADEARRGGMPGLCAEALATAAAAWLENGNVTMALALSRRAVEIRDELEALEEDEAEVFLAYARALWEDGDREAARAIVARGRARLEELAARIADPDWRRRFLEDVPTNRELMSLEL